MPIADRSVVAHFCAKLIAAYSSIWDGGIVFSISSQYRTELSTVRVGDDLEFLNRINDGRYCIGALIGDEVVQAIGQDVITAVGLPVDGGKGE